MNSYMRCFLLSTNNIRSYEFIKTFHQRQALIQGAFIERRSFPFFLNLLHPKFRNRTGRKIFSDSPPINYSAFRARQRSSSPPYLRLTFSLARKSKRMDRSQKKHRRTHLRFWYIIPIGVALGLILSYSSPSSVSLLSNGNGVIYLQTAPVSTGRSRPPHIEPPPPRDRCSGRYVYMHGLPSRFNSDLLRDCLTLSQWVNMCVATSNAGLGPLLGDSKGVFSDEGWYATDQFGLEVIFHNRMKQYECLTTNSSRASAVFVPYYAGFDVSRYLWGHNATLRDSLSLDLVRWLKSRPEWTAMEGQDHFVVAGRTTWDFRNANGSEDSWGNKFLDLPETKNMTVLAIESSPILQMFYLA